MIVSSSREEVPCQQCESQNINAIAPVPVAIRSSFIRVLLILLGEKASCQYSLITQSKVRRAEDHSSLDSSKKVAALRSLFRERIDILQTFDELILTM